ncbi:hypothetical protein BDN72DRAFT_840758 [Pluteus cervinus]|uniref:Uncharacterized protein n=1 Tax=Pluteus cervinus TaxID=181527 RepID=A0ACD3ATH7_9AGAR|nr:hypothetical protein BDN72DRAFT_840758 [Pluteus cervinus]
MVFGCSAGLYGILSSGGMAFLYGAGQNTVTFGVTVTIGTVTVSIASGSVIIVIGAGMIGVGSVYSMWWTDLSFRKPSAHSRVPMLQPAKPFQDSLGRKGDLYSSFWDSFLNSEGWNPGRRFAVATGRHKSMDHMEEIRIARR